ncbi:MAG: hypothetical protein QOF76_343 [Solirubrobacteraceae bacterium]|nr:hypothetical protein [Solirubrobacteraceae bacterium]
MTPEDALNKARAAAAEGDYTEPEMSFDAAPVDRISDRRLAEWALIEVDMSRVRSTRRLGKPLTWTKHRLIRFLSQYNNEVQAQQSRFNAMATAHILNLEKRIAELEDERDAK